MKIIRNNFLYFLLFLIPFLLIFKNVLSTYPTVFGDAPYFYPEKLLENLREPLLWDYRTSNFGDFQGHLVWLYLINFITGFSYYFLGVNQDLINKLIFYIPTILLSFISSYFFLQRISSNKRGIFLGSLFYTFNTYILSVLDGGQVGFGLAYSIFPLSILFFERLVNQKNIKNFLIYLVTLFILSNFDIRVLILSFILSILWLFIFIKKNSLRNLFIILVSYACLALLDSFFLFPLVLSFKLSSNLNFGISGSETVAILHALLIYHPNFPLNEFGRVLYPPFYFLIIPLFVFIGFFLSRKSELFLNCGLLYLLFAFLSKGSSPPFGDIYNFITSTLPLGFSFRDSTKFFVPLILITATLFVIFFDDLNRIKNISKKLIFVFCYLMILLLVSPAVMTNLSGSFALNTRSIEYKEIANNLKSEKDFYRTLWFPEVPPMGYQDFNHPAISANNLFEDRPFASMIVGNYDLFYFLNNRDLISWFRLLGIRYLAIDENLRKKVWTPQELNDRTLFLEFVDNIFHKNLNWSPKIPVYFIENTLPHFFYQDKVWLVVGGENVYDELFKHPNFKLENQGFLFSEYQDFDFSILKKVDKNALIIIFNDTEKEDLKMSLLKTYFGSTNNSLKNEYKYFSSSHYLDWKYELLKNGVVTKDLDFGKGISTSTKKDEIINLQNDLKPGKYYLGVRFTNATDSAGINFSYNNKEVDLYNPKTNHFIWKTIGPVDITKNLDITVRNLGGFVAINSIAVIPAQEFDQATNKTNILLATFKNYSLDDVELLLVNQKSPDIKGFKIIQNNPTSYSITTHSEYNWLVFTDHYDRGWSIDETKAVPLYNMVNGFYVGNLEGKDLHINFEPQKIIYKGIIISLASLFLILVGTIIILIYRKSNDKL